MDKSDKNENIGTGWIIAIIALLVLLALGIICYLQTGVTVKKTQERVSLVRIHKQYTGESIGEYRQNSYHRNG